MKNHPPERQKLYKNKEKTSKIKKVKINSMHEIIVKRKKKNSNHFKKKTVFSNKKLMILPLG